MLKAFKYELNPNDTQKVLLSKHFGCSRFVFNWALNEKSKAYSQDRKNINYFNLASRITDLKKQEEFYWLLDVNSQVLQMSLRNLDNAYTRFFHKKANFPRFKKKNNTQSFQCPQGIKIKDNEIYLPKIGWINFYLSRPFIGIIKTVTVSKKPSGKYFISILCDNGLVIPEKRKIKKETSVGIDLGIKSFAVTSDGNVFENQKYLGKNLLRLRVEQRKLQRAVKGSNNRNKQRVVIAKLHEKITNQRFDYIHKISSSLVSKYDTIIMEDLAIANMLKNHNLARSISDQGWSMLNEQLKYKCDWYGKNYIKINRFEPSLKICNCCGHINNGLVLSNREWICINCNSKNDRDLNASLNIRDFGLGAKPTNAKISQ